MARKQSKQQLKRVRNLTPEFFDGKDEADMNVTILKIIDGEPRYQAYSFKSLCTGFLFVEKVMSSASMQTEQSWMRVEIDGKPLVWHQENDDRFTASF